MAESALASLGTPPAAASGAVERGEEVSIAGEEKDAAMGPAGRANEETEVRSG